MFTAAMSDAPYPKDPFVMAKVQLFEFALDNIEVFVNGDKGATEVFGEDVHLPCAVCIENVEKQSGVIGCLYYAYQDQEGDAYSVLYCPHCHAIYPGSALAEAVEEIQKRWPNLGDLKAVRMKCGVFEHRGSVTVRPA